MGPVSLTGRGVENVLPPAVAQKAVVSAGHDFSSVAQDDSICRLDRDPLVEHCRQSERSVFAVSDRAVNRGSDLKLKHWLVSSVCGQNRRVAMDAELAGVRATAIRVHGPSERHA